MSHLLVTSLREFNFIALNISHFSYCWQSRVMNRWCICFYAELIRHKIGFLLPSPFTPFLTQESLFCHQRKPLFFKSGKSDIFRSKKFAMSLFRAIFAFGNGREMANFVLDFPECLRSGFALASLPEAKKNTRQCGCRDTAQTRELWHICLLDYLKTRGWNLYVSPREIGKS